MSIFRVLFHSLLGGLCLFAMYTTLTMTTDMNKADIQKFFFDSFQPIVQVQAESLPLHDVKMSERMLHSFVEDTTYISSEEIEETKSIEEAIDFSQYDTKRVTATGYTAGVESTGKKCQSPRIWHHIFRCKSKKRFIFDYSSRFRCISFRYDSIYP